MRAAVASLASRAGSLAAALMLALTATAADDELAPAEIALFMTDHLQKLAVPTQLKYAFTRRGSLEPEFNDSVEVDLEASPDGGRNILTRCLSGERRLELPALDFAQGNPALLCFLERDIRQMERLTGGRANYFRQRIRLALAGHAEVREVKLTVGEKQVAGREIRIAPYLDDPRRDRYARYAGKFYVFRVSDEVPGGIVDVDAVIPDGSAQAAPDAAGLLVEELKFVAATSDKKGNKEK